MLLENLDIQWLMVFLLFNKMLIAGRRKIERGVGNQAMEMCKSMESIDLYRVTWVCIKIKE